MPPPNRSEHVNRKDCPLLPGAIAQLLLRYSFRLAKLVLLKVVVKIYLVSPYYLSKPYLASMLHLLSRLHSISSVASTCYAPYLVSLPACASIRLIR
jgi:hypothetical protein